jgi:hypothetical protein
MDVSGWLRSQATRQPLLFPGKRHGPTKRLIGRLLAVANAGAAGTALAGVSDEFYRLKARLLESYGERDGTDWQVIERACWGCEFCRDGNDYYGYRDGKCDGKGVFSRRYHPLARTRLGGVVFHTPGLSQTEPPAAPIVFRGRVLHRKVKAEDARAAFLTLCLLFDRELFRDKADALFAIKPWGLR